MAWSVPLTAVSSAALTASQWNASVRDNLLETAPAKATAAGGYFVATGPNVIAERFIAQDIIDTSETTTSTSYTSIATDGPTVTVTSGTRAMVWLNCQASNSGTSSSVASFEVSGATTSAASDSRAVIVEAAAGNAVRASTLSLISLTAGSNTFRMLYRVSGGTGTFQRRRIIVMPL